jgi:hypothetical protein
MNLLADFDREGKGKLDWVPLHYMVTVQWN